MPPFDPLQLRRDKPLLPGATAVLIVDAQCGEATEAHRTDHPEYWAALQGRALPAMRQLIDGARAVGAEIVYTVIESLTRDGRDRSLDHKLSGIHFARGSAEAQVLPEVAPAEDDIVLPKTSSGVFNSTSLDYVLRNLGVENVVVAGLLTDQCVDMAVRDGADRGYYMICAENACATYTAERHATALKAFGGYCRVMTVDETLAALAAG
ncbi:cysteine hydrolase family protein [Acidimangrovimonas sediminis]|uniref:cysteine hydrolase family protein n=1 Tax=Acidimangrovimonas sediminis TaxID=2056283 RepID=UPI000C80C5ED|nr:isochorismatase family cysteine hydrolase [Acidimangrovimonas sediminis]